MNILLLFLFVSVVCGERAQSYLKCNKNYPKLETCLREMLEDLKEDLIVGRMNFPPIDPFKHDFVTFIEDDTNVTARNIIVEGGRHVEIEKLKLKPNDVYHLKATLRLPVLKMSAEYSFEHVVFFINLGGEGQFTGTFYNISVTVEAKARPYKKKKGKTYLELNSFDLYVTVDDIDMFLSNDDIVSNEVRSRFQGSKKKYSILKLTSTIEKRGKKVTQKYIRGALSTTPVEKFLYNGPRPQYTEENEIYGYKTSF